MNSQSFVLLTIVTEAVLEPTIAEDVIRMGARGYTVTDSRGSGSHGVRSGAWGQGSNVRVEVIGNEEMINNIITHLRDSYDQNYGLLMFSARVDVHSR
jgi:hypothetical protein